MFQDSMLAELAQLLSELSAYCELSYCEPSSLNLGQLRRTVTVGSTAGRSPVPSRLLSSTPGYLDNLTLGRPI